MDNDEQRQFRDRLQKLISDNLTMECLNVAFMADRLNMSESTLFRRVKEATGVGCKEYIRNVRLEKAFQRLKKAKGANEPIAIGSVAFQCGFSSLASFAKAFRKRYGMSATDFLTHSAPHETP